MKDWGLQLMKEKLYRINERTTIIIDEADYDNVRQFCWYSNYKKNKVKFVYTMVLHKGKARMIRLTHYLMGKPPKGFVIDHINRNCADNRRSNLRVCTVGENNFNKIGWSKASSYKGVSYYDRNLKKPWKAYISYGKVHIEKRFKTEKEAVLSYNRMAKKYHGEYALLNIIK